jgi:hypothetical protein
MTVTVAPLTTTVMGAVKSAHAGVASGINNTVSRVAGLLAIAVFGVVLARKFDAAVKPKLDSLALPAAARAQIDEQLPKMAGAEIGSVGIDGDARLAVQRSIDDAFVSGFRVVMFGAAGVALAAAVFGAGTREESAAKA